MRALGELLQDNETLLSLNLAWNVITPKATERLSSTLMLNATLTARPAAPGPK